MIPSSERLVSKTRCSPSLGDEMDATLSAHVLTEDEALRVHLELVPQGSPNRLGETDDFSAFVGGLRAIERRALGA